MRIYFARHGESQANVLHEISNRELRHKLAARDASRRELWPGGCEGFPSRISIPARYCVRSKPV